MMAEVLKQLADLKAENVEIKATIAGKGKKFKMINALIDSGRITDQDNDALVLDHDAKVIARITMD